MDIKTQIGISSTSLEYILYNLGERPNTYYHTLFTCLLSSERLTELTNIPLEYR